MKPNDNKSIYTLPELRGSPWLDRVVELAVAGLLLVLATGACWCALAVLRAH